MSYNINWSFYAPDRDELFSLSSWYFTRWTGGEPPGNRQIYLDRETNKIEMELFGLTDEFIRVCDIYQMGARSLGRADWLKLDARIREAELHRKLLYRETGGFDSACDEATDYVNSLREIKEYWLRFSRHYAAYLSELTLRLKALKKVFEYRANSAVRTLTEAFDSSASLERQALQSKAVRPRPENLRLGDLTGPLWRKYARAVNRGYRGDPQHWLRNARQARNFPGWHRRMSVMDRTSPLHWYVVDDHPVFNRMSSVAEGIFPNIYILRRDTYDVVTKCNERWAKPVPHACFYEISSSLNAPAFLSTQEVFRFCLHRKNPARGRFDRSTGTVRLSVRELNTDIHLARKIVANCIVGLRSYTIIPKRYRWCFRRCGGFLLPVVGLPAGLVRFLLSRWAVDPTSVWLVENSTLRKFLRSVPKDILEEPVETIGDQPMGEGASWVKNPHHSLWRLGI